MEDLAGCGNLRRYYGVECVTSRAATRSMSGGARLRLRKVGVVDGNRWTNRTVAASPDLQVHSDRARAVCAAMGLG